MGAVSPGSSLNPIVVLCSEQRGKGDSPWGDKDPTSLLYSSFPPMKVPFAPKTLPGQGTRDDSPLYPPSLNKPDFSPTLASQTLAFEW